MNRLHRYFPVFLAGCLSLGLTLCVFVGSVSARATVIASNPKAGSTIAKAPALIQVTTAEKMTTTPSDTNMFVYDPKGDVVSTEVATVDPNNPLQMSVPIKTDGSDGVYIVRWLTKSASDDDLDAGAFYFTVNANAATTSNTSTIGSSIPLLPAVIAGVIILIVGLGTGFGIGRRGFEPR